MLIIEFSIGFLGDDFQIPTVRAYDKKGRLYVQDKSKGPS